MIDKELWNRLVWKNQLPYTYGFAWLVGMAAAAMLWTGLILLISCF